MLGGTDGLSWDKVCSLAPLDCDEGKGSNGLSGGVKLSLELVDGDDHCVESGEKNLAIVDQSKFSKEIEESSKGGKSAEVDWSGPAGIGNCNKELRFCSEPKSLEELDVNVASYP